jgi:hypothetical protein
MALGRLDHPDPPGISGAPAWARVRAWLTGSGDPAASAGSRAGKVLTAVVLAIDEASVAGIVLITCYWLCHRRPPGTGLRVANHLGAGW